MRQKILCLIVLFSLVLTLTGCGSNKTVSPENQAAVSDVKAEDNPVAGNTDAASTDETDNAAVDQHEEDIQQNDQQGNTGALVSEDFLMQIEDVFSITGRGTVVTGVVLSGQVSTDAEVELVGLADEPVTITVGGIEMFRELLDTAVEGDNVGILLNDIQRSDVQRGQVLAAKGSISAHNTFSANIAFIEKQSDVFYSQGSFTALSNFFATDSNTIYYFGQARPDENGIISVKAKMLAKLPMKEGTPFRVLLNGTSIAVGVVTGVDVEITTEPAVENADMQDNAIQPAISSPDAGTASDTADQGAAEFSVKLLNYGDQKIQVIKVIREVTGLDLKAAKELADYTPSIIKKDITQKEAESIKAKLEGAGAAVEIIK